MHPGYRVAPADDIPPNLRTARLLAEEALRRKIINEYADLLYYRDLLDQFSIRNEHVMHTLLKHCLSQPATLLSPHKLFHDFRSQGITISENTIQGGSRLEWLNHGAYLFKGLEEVVEVKRVIWFTLWRTSFSALTLLGSVSSSVH